MKKMFFMLCSLAVASLLQAQNPAQNQVDDQGRKTGPWKVEHPNGQTLYEATFEDGRPVGEMLRYYDSGALRARMYFFPDGPRSNAILFYQNGKMAAEGYYMDQLKDSVWTYYSEFDGTVRMRETYVSGKLDGPLAKYYPDGTISEEIIWKADSREGYWRQFYEDGSPRLVALYSDDQLNGTYKVYFRNGRLIMQGDYLNNRSTGTWEYYEESGKLLYELEYKDGMPLDQELYMELMQDTLLGADSLLIPEPDQLF